MYYYITALVQKLPLIAVVLNQTCNPIAPTDIPTSGSFTSIETFLFKLLWINEQ
jgi:hypothetical protein